ncbi:MAG: hypothetical protein JSU68_09815 [Phycisphaerales bacterium]|nr:MAG: hypothetical protein JSU68_09815 [Phycisphaerales bacterium]
MALKILDALMPLGVLERIVLPTAAWTQFPSAGPDEMPGLVLIVTLAFAAVVLLQGSLYRRRRERAWPDHLEYLQAGFKPWWPLRPLGVLVGLVVLGVGIGGMDRWTTVVSAVALGASLLVLAHRRWSEPLAYLGLALITLMVCAALATIAGFFTELGWARPLLWSCVLSGMAVMTFMWLWLPPFWSQQLYEGQAWTTTGRLIVPARRVGYVVAVIGLIVAVRMAVWPRWPSAGAEDGMESGGWLGGGAIVVLLLALVNRAKAARSIGLGVLATLAVMTGGIYCWLRV